MSKFSKTAKMVGKIAEEAKAAKKIPWYEKPDDVIAPITEIPKQYKHAFDTVDEYVDWLNKNKNYDILQRQKRSKTVDIPPKPIVSQEGPATLSETNKLYNPEISGVVDYKKAKAIAPMGAAQGLYEDLQRSGLGDMATKWSKLKSMVADKVAGQMDLSGGKDPEFQEQASGVLSTTLDPVNFIPGVGGVAAGAMEMLAREEELKKKGK